MTKLDKFLLLRETSQISCYFIWASDSIFSLLLYIDTHIPYKYLKKRIYHCSGPLIGASPKSKRVNKKPVLIVPSPHGSFIFQRLQSTLKINHNFYLVAFYPP